MDTPPRTAAALTNRGIAAERAGDRDEARRFFAEALTLDPSYELAWLWYATVAEEPGERLYCLNRALEIHPESAARAARAELAGVEPVVPAALADLAEPPLPPQFASRASSGIRGHIRPPAAARRISVRPRLADAAGRIRLPLRMRDEQEDDSRTKRNRILSAIAGLLLLLAILAGVYAWLRPNRDVVYVAFVGALSGPFSFSGQESADSVRLYFDQVNQNGGIDGREVLLLTYDDQSDPDLARQRAEEIIADGRALLVIGHDTSEASIAAGPIYEAAGIPAITGGATADNVTADNPWYFRTVFTNGSQGELIATYVDQVLDLSTASVVYDDDNYGRSLFDGFSNRFQDVDGTVKHAWPVAAADRDAAIGRIVDELAADPDPGIVVLALPDVDARDLIAAIRGRGLSPPMIGSDVLGTEGFQGMFTAYPEEEEQPGFYTNGLYAVSPFLYDAAGGEAVAFLDRFRHAFGYLPDGWAVKAYDAAIAAVYAIDAADVTGAPDGRAADRQRIRDSLAALDSLQTAIPGIEGPLYFDQTRSFPQAIWIGRFEDGQLGAALEQVLPVVDPVRYDVEAEVASGAMTEIEGQYFNPTRVVYTGVDLNEINNLDTANQTFVADFFL